MPRIVALPDAEGVTVKHLLADATLDVLGNRIATRLPKDPVFPRARIRRLGGLPVDKEWIDRARLQVEVFSEDEVQAHDIAQLVRVSLHNMVGVHPDAVVTRVDDDFGIMPSPDPETGTPRYLFGVAITLHPLPA